MKNFKKTLFLLSLISLFSFTVEAQSWQIRGVNSQGYNINQNQHIVKSYYRSNGTYVNSYTRTNPNRYRYDNISFFILPEVY